MNDFQQTLTDTASTVTTLAKLALVIAAVSLALWMLAAWRSR